VLAEFVGARETKVRPLVVISTQLFHQHHPDLIVGLLTTQLRVANTPTDYILRDWQAAGLHQPSAFRAYLGMVPADRVIRIGRLSDRDWKAVQECLRRAIAFR
jgi:mRNA interferase MazF